MKKPNFACRSLLCAAAGLTMLIVANSATPAFAQASDAAEKCTPDVMRLCSEFIPDKDRIVGCLRAKRRQLSPGCSTALGGGHGASTTKKAKTKTKKHHARHKAS